MQYMVPCKLSEGSRKGELIAEVEDESGFRHEIPVLCTRLIASRGTADYCLPVHLVGVTASNHDRWLIEFPAESYEGTLRTYFRKSQVKIHNEQDMKQEPVTHTAYDLEALIGLFASHIPAGRRRIVLANAGAEDTARNLDILEAAKTIRELPAASRADLWNRVMVELAPQLRLPNPYEPNRGKPRVHRFNTSLPAGISSDDKTLFLCMHQRHEQELLDLLQSTRLTLISADRLNFHAPQDSAMHATRMQFERTWMHQATAILFWTPDASPLILMRIGSWLSRDMKPLFIGATGSLVQLIKLQIAAERRTKPDVAATIQELAEQVLAWEQTLAWDVGPG